MIKEPRWADNAYLAADSGPHSVFSIPPREWSREFPSFGFTRSPKSGPTINPTGFLIESKSRYRGDINDRRDFCFFKWNLSHFSRPLFSGWKHEIRRDWIYMMLVLEREGGEKVLNIVYSTSTSAPYYECQGGWISWLANRLRKLTIMRMWNEWFHSSASPFHVKNRSYLIDISLISFIDNYILVQPRLILKSYATIIPLLRTTFPPSW